MKEQLSAPSSLSYGVRPSVIAKYLGQLFFVSAATSFIPLVASIVFGDFGISLAYLAVIGFFSLCGFFSRGIEAPKKVQFNEAYVIVGLAFLLTSFILSFPVKMIGISWIDAWFETVSGITTTGLSTLRGVEEKARTFIFSRSWMQWYGGLGIVVLSMGLAMQPGTVAKKLSATLTDQEEIIGSTRAHARKVFFIYTLFTIAAVITFLIFGLPLLPSLALAFSSISTGGFSPFNDSLQSLPLSISYFVVLFSLLGAISFPLYWIYQKKQLTALLGNIQLWTILICCFVVFCLYVFFSSEGVSVWSQAIIETVSAQSTAGFTSAPISTLSNGSKLILIGSMMIGGSSFSTAGGIKVFRLLILLKALHRIFFNTSLSKHAVYENTVGGYRIDSEEREKAYGIIFFFLTWMFFSWVCFVGYGFDPLNSLFEVTSALGTVGLSTGIVSTELPFFLKSILCIDMFLGRLEFLTFLVLFYPRTLFGRRIQV